jgi:hypothetical protein
MSPWKWWSRRRLAVWDKRLKRRRAIWESIPVLPSLEQPGMSWAPERWLYWEAQVTKALAKRVKWRKRAGIRKATGGPVTKGQPFLRGEQDPPELFIPYEQGKKLSPPPGKPEPRLPDPGQPERGKP